MSAKKAIQTIGRRKCALARATLLKGTGRVLINQRLIENMTPFLVRERLLEHKQIEDYDFAKKMGCNFIAIKNKWNKWDDVANDFPVVADVKEISKLI